MSEGYASRLSAYPNKGVVGLPENYDSKRVLNIKLQRLTEMVEACNKVVILTGAGISTAANIPDFRGPNGIWTLEKKLQSKARRNKKQKLLHHHVPESDEVTTTKMDFSDAKPTLTHRAITFLAMKGKLQYCITQNVDGLHKRSGLSRDYHAALHGCVFTEKCHKCHAEYFGDRDCGGMSFQPTGNKCQMEGCDGDLHDTLLDWEDLLPEADLKRANHEAEDAELMLCLGTSLRIQPVGNFPLRAKRFVIVNLQETPIDEDAALVIRATVDVVMDELLKRLGYSNWQAETLPPIERQWRMETNLDDCGVMI